MSKKAGAAGGGLITGIVMLLGLSVMGNNPDVIAQIHRIQNQGLPSVTATQSSIHLPKIPTSIPSIPRSIPSIPSKSNPAPVQIPAAQVAAAKAALDTLPVKPRTRTLGYERTKFGQAWTDNNDALMGHNGCDTRNDVLAQQMKNVTYKDGTRACIVMTGVLNDPYTGKTINFTKAKASAVQIDHVFPLSAAWDMGASTWPQAKRVKFANDPALNLMAVDGPTNGGKGDKTPSVWMPPNPGYQCGYSVKFIAVAKAYGLNLSTEDKAALTRGLATCR